MIDSHCHLNFHSIKDDFENIILEIKKANLTSLLTINTLPNEFNDHLNLIKNYKSIYISYGLHPQNVDNKITITKDEILKNILLQKVIGIGETGLDFYYNHSKKDTQIKLFIEHIKAAQDSKLPLIVHTRSAENETYQILKSELKNKSFKILIHCFTGSKDFAHNLLDLGCYISASGIVTFKNSTNLANTFKEIPNNRILVETDSPYLSPDPLRGKTNEPSHIIHTVKFLSKLKDLNTNDFSMITSENFFNLFGKLN